MGSKKQGFILTLVCLLAAPRVFAATISFLVVETGVREGGPVNEASNLWETGLLDVFFDAGHIVSNAPILSLTKSSNQEIPDEARGDVEEALRGGADFFVLALLDYQGAPAGASKIKPQTVSLRLFKTRPQTFLYEQLYAPRGQESGDNELANARRVVRLLLPHLNALDE